MTTSCAQCLILNCPSLPATDPPAPGSCTIISANYGSNDTGTCYGVLNFAQEQFFQLVYWYYDSSSGQYTNTTLSNSIFPIYVSLDSQILTNISQTTSSNVLIIPKESGDSNLGAILTTTQAFIDNCVTPDPNGWTTCTTGTPFYLQFYQNIYFEYPPDSGELVYLPYGWACTKQSSDPASNSVAISTTVNSVRSDILNREDDSLSQTKTVERRFPITQTYSFTDPYIYSSDINSDFNTTENSAYYFKNIKIADNVKFTFLGNAIFEDCEFLGDLQIENSDNSIVIFQNSTQFTSNIFSSTDPNVSLTIRGKCIFNGKIEMVNVRKSADIPSSVFNFNFVGENYGNSDFSNFSLTEKGTGKMIDFILDQTNNNSSPNISYSATNRIYVVKL